MRVLDRSAVSLDLAVLGLQAEDESHLRALTTLPHGIAGSTSATERSREPDAQIRHDVGELLVGEAGQRRHVAVAVEQQGDQSAVAL